ncbi:hypothetical protein FZC78_21100 [Rossellomorea vietnamensis]|uniref:Uncharacterized protein n=1 Tax=Rossellomorea vietnamensis TaxID=218284 RepID=A0A5D4NL75_9BACI|nr:hypothetical protein FZC78_21100 [Rossellomorea vietnamensis]
MLRVNCRSCNGESFVEASDYINLRPLNKQYLFKRLFSQTLLLFDRILRENTKRTGISWFAREKRAAFGFFPESNNLCENSL